MIERYTPNDFKNFFSDKEKFKLWLKIEILNLEALSKKGILDKKILESLKKKIKIDIKDIKKREEILKHDVIAFIESCTKNLKEEEKRFFHFGLTSSDIVDTAFSYLLKKGVEKIIERHKIYLKNLENFSKKYKYLVQIGRTHGMHAEPTTLGLKFLSFYSEGLRNLKRLEKAKEEISYGKISGSVGNYLNVDPDVEDYILKNLGLKVEPVSTQIVPRDRYAFLMSVIGLCASALERVALEIRNLQREEIFEVSEPFTKGQKGSSSMPHKRNPIFSERICGLTRIIRGYVLTSFENIPLWHERDISHSSNERIIFPDAIILICYMYDKINYLIENLEVFPDNINKNLELTKGRIFSQSIMNELILKGMERKKAYEKIMEIVNVSKGRKIHFKDAILLDKEIQNYLKKEEIEKIFDYDEKIKKRVDFIFERVFKLKNG
jgi:adenylosuccinate lyase